MKRCFLYFFMIVFILLMCIGCESKPVFNDNLPDVQNGYFSDINKDNYIDNATSYEIEKPSAVVNLNPEDYGSKFNLVELKNGSNIENNKKLLSKIDFKKPTLLNRYDINKAPWNENYNYNINGGEIIVKKINNEYISYKNGLEEGKSSDFAELISAIASSNSPKIIIIDNGNYELLKTINIKSNTFLFGYNKPILTKKFNGAAINMNSASENVFLSNIFIDGNSSNFNGDGIIVEDFSNKITLINMSVDQIGGNGIIFSGSNNKKSLVSKCKVTNIVGGAGIAFYSSAGESFVEKNFVYRTRHHAIIISMGGSNCLIKNNTTIESGFYRKDGDFAHGIAIDGSGVVHGQNHIIRSNTIINSGLAGIEVADYQDNVIIELNYIDGTGAFVKQDDYGIYFGGGLTPSIGCIIRDNVIKNTRGFGIRSDSPNNQPYTKNVQIINNNIENAGTDGIKIGKVFNVMVIGNTMKNVSCKERGYCGIFLNRTNIAEITRNTISDNRDEVRNMYNIEIIDSVNITCKENILGKSIKTNSYS